MRKIQMIITSTFSMEIIKGRTNLITSDSSLPMPRRELMRKRMMSTKMVDTLTRRIWFRKRRI